MIKEEFGLYNTLKKKYYPHLSLLTIAEVGIGISALSLGIFSTLHPLVNFPNMFMSGEGFSNLLLGLEVLGFTVPIFLFTRADQHLKQIGSLFKRKKKIDRIYSKIEKFESTVYSDFLKDAIERDSVPLSLLKVLTDGDEMNRVRGKSERVWKNSGIFSILDLETGENAIYVETHSAISQSIEADRKARASFVKNLMALVATLTILAVCIVAVTIGKDIYSCFLMN